jgi:hypothetical protein
MRALTTTIWSMQPLLLFTGPSIAAATGLPFELTVYVAYGMMGLAQGGSTLIWGLGAMYFADRQDVPVYMGVHTGLTGLRRMLAPLVGAVIVSQYSFNAVFGVAWGLQLLAVAMVFTLARFESHGGRLEPFAEREEREARAETAARKNARKQ